jgi:hypothetical protein
VVVCFAFITLASVEVMDRFGFAAVVISLSAAVVFFFSLLYGNDDW